MNRAIFCDEQTKFAHMKTVVTNAKEYQINDFLNHAATNCDKLSIHGLCGRKGRYEVIKELFDNIMNTIKTAIPNIINNTNNVELFIKSIAKPFSEAVAVFGKDAKYVRCLSCLIESDIAKKVFTWSKNTIDNLEMKQSNQINDLLNVGIIDKFSFFSFSNKDGGKMLLLNMAHTFIKIIDSLWNNEEIFYQTQNLVSSIMDKFMKTPANKLALSKDKKSKKIYEKEFRWIIIFKLKHATYYGMAMSVKRICEVIMRNEKSILPVSHMIHGVYDIDGVSLSMPVIVGVDGIESNIPINLSGEEALKLKKSADSLKKIIETIEL